jgi:hypothetical protein
MEALQFTSVDWRSTPNRASLLLIVGYRPSVFGIETIIGSLVISSHTIEHQDPWLWGNRIPATSAWGVALDEV